VNDPWVVLRRFTQARIGLGRCGSGLPTAALLEFQLAHAQARDAVHVPWDLGRFAEEVRGLGVEPVTVQSAVTDRGEYLRRPDLGRKLTEASRERLAGLASPMDVCLIITNGLSSTAVERHGLPLLSAVLLAFGARHLSAGPVVLTPNGRVALSDEVGELLGARAAAIIVGERPGLSAADSLGIYLTYGPRPGTTDAQRNCISNVRPPEGLGYEAAATKLAYLAAEALRRGVSGVALKDEGAGGGPRLSTGAVPIADSR
jgi:ethanolamine ammonia-lyase small subunit